MQLRNMHDFQNPALATISLSSFSKLQLTYLNSFLLETFFFFLAIKGNTLGNVTDANILEKHLQNLRNVSLFSDPLIYMNPTTKKHN